MELLTIVLLFTCWYYITKSAVKTAITETLNGLKLTITNEEHKNSHELD